MRGIGRAAQVMCALASLVIVCSCESVDDPFPAQSAVNIDVTFSAIGTQSAPLPTPQVVIWSIDEASAADITGFADDYSFLRSPPCFYPLNIASRLTLSGACRVSGLTLTQGVERTAILTFRVSSMELRQAARPDLRIGADPDGDGVPNGTDNCPIVANPDQANVNAAQEITLVGDACSIDDTSTPPSPTIPDSDLDGVANVVDNCLWYANPLGDTETSQPDSDRDGIGDACERVAPVILPPGGLAVTCDVEFTTRSSVPSVFRLDFARAGVLTCDSGFTGCTIDPDALEVALAGTAESFPCEPIP